MGFGQVDDFGTVFTGTDGLTSRTLGTRTTRKPRHITQKI